MKKDDINTPIVESEEEKELGLAKSTPLYKRVLAIVGLVFFGGGVMSLIASFIASGSLENVFQVIALVGMFVGFMIFLFLYMSNSMPFKKEKKREEERIRMEYLKRKAEEESGDNENEEENIEENIEEDTKTTPCENTHSPQSLTESQD